VLLLMHQKTCALLAVVLACLTIVLVIECQMHDLPSAHKHAASTGHHQSHSAPGHTMGGIPCMPAVLPIWILFFVLTSVRLHTVSALVPSAVPSLPPFVPPRQATRSFLRVGLHRALERELSSL
jgi:hypothetical protein